MDGNAHGNGHPQHEVLVQQAAIPELRKAFTDALDRVDHQLELADTELRVAEWAHDPVSKDAATRFNQRSVDTGESALDMLRAYRQQLSTAVENLDKTAEQYRLVEQDNSAAVTQGEAGAG